MLCAQTLQDAQRFDEALAMLEGLIARQPSLPQWHRLYNELLYRLDRHDEALKSYDRAQDPELLLDKAYFLSHEARARKRWRCSANWPRATRATSPPPPASQTPCWP
jgi:tetratricopeptide (TPR) repeat protein